VNVIEQAAKRLEELQKAGIAVPHPPATEDSPATQRSRAEAERKLPHAGEAAGDAERGSQTSPERASAEEPLLPSRHIDLDLGRLRAAGMITPDLPNLKLAEEFRVIKWPLLQNVRGKSAAPIDRANLIMVTSSTPGEGKSFVSANLAVSIAMEVDTSVLLIDADVTARSMEQIFGITAPHYGLMDLLSRPELELSAAAVTTNIPRLSILTAGQSHPRATELLASQAMRALLDKLAGRRDLVVVFDSPPLLATSESRVLATYMGQVTVVVEANRTTRTKLEQALDTVSECPVVMTILNKARESDVGSYYGYRQHGASG
jgi:receptor protein-tyrosine kinase